MEKIEVACLNPTAITEAKKMAAFAARLTQRGHQLQSMKDVKALYDKPYTESLMHNLSAMPHPTLQKFATINIVVFGASRRFLAQITRHQNEVKFMSASLQYSDYADVNQFVVPYPIIKADVEHRGNAQYAENYHRTQYINSCTAAMNDYTRAREQGVDNDSCGYMAPHGLRNILLIGATPFQWKHMIHQRTCNRNTPEMQYVMLKIWELLYTYAPTLFEPKTTGPFCQQGSCKEGTMCCGKMLDEAATPSELLQELYPLLNKEDK